MNIRQYDILRTLFEESYVNQRILAETTGYSLGTVNHAVNELKKDGYLDAEMKPTLKAREEIKSMSPQRAVILAAGLGMRMIPINTETTKGLLKVKDETLIERIIKQLHEVGIVEIYVVVGFMKEQYEFLIDQYGVELIVNSSFATKSNLHSLKLAKEHLNNSYIIPCDLWCNSNPFRRYELYSWYMVSTAQNDESNCFLNKKKELVVSDKQLPGNEMLGICYLCGKESEYVKQRLTELCNKRQYDKSFWEEALCIKDKMIVWGRIIREREIIEVNTYEQLRSIDMQTDCLNNRAIEVICEVLKANKEEITNIEISKKGMTNRSFLFSCKGKRYIMRIPGEGTDMLMNRKQEENVYTAIKNRNISDNVVFISSESGYKISEYIENAHTCDPTNKQELKKCMEHLRAFHDKKLSVEHEFDIFRHIDYYESLWGDTPSIYKDYKETKSNVLSLKPFVDAHSGEKVLTHIDAVPDNFLLFKNGKKEEIRLIDWEYAGMQDPHVDIAMFCIYSLYNREQIDELISIYFNGDCNEETRIKIYCYISMCGLLWSNWCEYKRNLGVEFGEYSLRQYRYAKEYYRIVAKKIKRRN